MFTATRKALLGNGTQKGALARSGIAAAMVATIFVVLDGIVAGDVAAALVTNRTALEPLWATAITMMFASKSQKV